MYSHPNILPLPSNSLIMSSSLISVNLKAARNADLPEFTGTAFRGWLGAVLRCARPACPPDCPDADRCPYRMVFKDDEVDINPYALLAFRDNGGVKGFIKVHGDRRRYVPEILSRIHAHDNARHFTGRRFKITGISAKTVEIPEFPLGDRTTVSFVTPVCLVRGGRMEIMPPLGSILAASARAFNRVTKRFDAAHYPCRIPDGLLKQDVPVLDFDVATVEVARRSRDGRILRFEGVTGWITYETSAIPPEAGNLLKAGEYLQIGKHTAYGFGGIIVTRAEA